MEKIFGLTICEANYNELIALIDDAISKNNRKKITYINFYGVNHILRDEKLLQIFNAFDFIHPDGIGIKIASRILFGKNGLKEKLTGSDFYPILLRNAEVKKWKLFLFGEKDELLKLFRSKYPEVNLCGTSSGYDYDTETVINNINNASPDILIVGLGCPKQEQWISDNYYKINPKVTLAVGAGIKVLCESQVRGPKIIQKLGLEWLFRIFLEPSRLWRRYVFGIPVFLTKVIYLRIKKLKI